MSTIGGYFELELPVNEEYHKDALKLNTGRNAFEYILRAKSYKKVYLPYYTCDVMLEPIKKLGLKFEFYNIGDDFNPIFDFDKVKQEDVFVYTNYWGICDNNVFNLVNKCKNIIIDNSQAFFSTPLSGIDTFYSARKFFGVPDGAYLYINKKLRRKIEQDHSIDRMKHLLGRIDYSAEEYYVKFKENDNALIGQSIKKMSNLTNRILKGINYKEVMEKRNENFNFMHSALKSYNELTSIVDIDLIKGPMAYPFLIIKDGIKEYLIKNKIYVANYWLNVFEWVDKDSCEYKLAKYLLPLPIDQRYNLRNMEKIIKIITKALT